MVKLIPILLLLIFAAIVYAKKSDDSKSYRSVLRMNGLSGKKMQKIFQAVVPPPMHNDARNFVEFYCFRFLSRDNSDIHVHLKVRVGESNVAWTKLYDLGEPQSHDVNPPNESYSFPPREGIDNEEAKGEDRQHFKSGWSQGSSF